MWGEIQFHLISQSMRYLSVCMSFEFIVCTICFQYMQIFGSDSIHIPWNCIFREANFALQKTNDEYPVVTISKEKSNNRNSFFFLQKWKATLCVAMEIASFMMHWNSSFEYAGTPAAIAQHPPCIVTSCTSAQPNMIRLISYALPSPFVSLRGCAAVKLAVRANWLDKIRKNISDTQNYRAVHLRLMTSRAFRCYRFALRITANQRSSVMEIRFYELCRIMFSLNIWQLNYYLLFVFIHSIFIAAQCSH